MYSTHCPFYDIDYIIILAGVYNLINYSKLSNFKLKRFSDELSCYNVYLKYLMVLGEKIKGL